MKEIKATALTTYDIAPDGERVRIRVNDEVGEESALVLPTESVGELMMTLPKMLQSAIQRQHRDPTLRLVHEVGHYSVERIAGADKCILTLQTPDGFEVSFAFLDADLADLAQTVTTEPENRQDIPRLM